MQAPIPGQPTPEAYNKFIAGLDLLNIRILRSDVDLRNVPHRTQASEISFNTQATTSYMATQAGFVAQLDCSLVLFQAMSGQRYGHINCLAVAEYSASIPMNDQLFSVFKSRNLPLNVWPFVREFVFSTVSRAGLPPLILPVLRG